MTPYHIVPRVFISLRRDLEGAPSSFRAAAIIKVFYMDADVVLSRIARLSARSWSMASPVKNTAGTTPLESGLMVTRQEK